MTVADRWRRVALVREALKELTAHVPEVQIFTDREIGNIHRLAFELQRIVTDGIKENPATFALVCELLDINPLDVRARLRI